MTSSDPSREAEQIVIGAAMLSATTVPALAAIVTTDDFYAPAHATIWRAIIDHHAADRPTDAAAIAHTLHATGDLMRIGGAPYLHELIASVPTTAMATYHAGLVASAARRRRIAETGARLAQAATTPGCDVDALVAESRAALDTGGDDDWDAPIPLTNAPNVPSFPTGMLPSWVADMVDAVTEATQTPSDLAGSIVLSCLSAAAGGRVIVEPVSGWTEQATLYTCVALGPGNRKSTVFDTLTRPIRDAETTLAEAARPAIIEASVEKAIAVKAADKAAAAADPSDPEAVTTAKSLAVDADEITVPAEPRLVADDITPEATKTLLAEQGGRMAIMSAEGGIFATIAGRYSGVPDLDVYLKSHEGDMLRVTRKQAADEHVDRPALTMGLAVQPSVLRDIASMPGFEDRGLLARFLFALPTSTVGHRCVTPDPVPAAVRDTYHRRLRDITETMWHASETTLSLTPEARDRVLQLEQEREPRLRDGGEWASILSWASKWTGAVIRIAGLLHVAAHYDTGWRGVPIDADTIDAAAHIGHYYAHHALAVWEHMATNTTATGPAVHVLDWLKQQQERTLSKRDIHRGLRRKLGPPQLDIALGTLVEHGYIRIQHPPHNRGRGRAPSPRIHINPRHTEGAE